MRSSAASFCISGTKDYDECIARNSINDRYKSCREIYPNDDVATLVREQRHLDPAKARPCVLVPSFPPVYYVPMMDTRSIITLKEFQDPFSALRAELNSGLPISDEVHGRPLPINKRAITAFMDDQAARLNGERTSAPLVATTACPTGQTGAPPDCLPTVTVPKSLEGRAAPAAGRGSPVEIVLPYQIALNVVTGSGLAIDGDYGRGTGSAVRRLQSWLNQGANGELAGYVGNLPVRVTGILDAETAKALIYLYQKRIPGLSATGLFDASTKEALDHAVLQALKGRPRYSAAGYFSSDANGSRRQDYLAIERSMGNRRPQITGLCYGRHRDCSVDADKIPGGVPSRADRYFVPAGTLGFATNLKTGEMVKIVAYDTGSPMHKTGELNPAALSAIGGNPNPRVGGLAKGQIQWCVGSKKPGGYKDEADLLDWMERFEGC